jgi:hypothetical protein
MVLSLSCKETKILYINMVNRFLILISLLFIESKILVIINPIKELVYFKKELYKNKMFYPKLYLLHSLNYLYFTS